MFDWTPERIETALALYHDGLTMPQIAAAIGAPGKNAVIGKIHRELVKRGLKPRKPSPTKGQPKRSYRRKPVLTLADEKPLGFLLPAVVPPPRPDEGQLASIVDVTGCRYPVRDDPAFIGGIAFCNHQQRDGSSYCEDHAKLVAAPYSQKLIERTISSIGWWVDRRVA